MAMHHLVRLARQMLRRINVELVRSARLKELEQLADWGTKSALLGMMRKSEVKQAIELFRDSSSQLNQDFFVLHELEHIPKTGEMFEWRGFYFEIIDMDGQRIDKLLVKVSEEIKEEMEEQ